MLFLFSNPEDRLSHVKAHISFQERGGSTEDEILGKMCLKCIATFVGGGLIAFIMIAIFSST